MTPRLRAESTGESMTLLGSRMVGLLSLESCCFFLKDEKLSFRRIKIHEIG